jgi:CheY-like chemotaxis protein
LIAEDSEADIFFLLRAFAASKVKNPIHVVRTGGEAIQYLSGDGKYASRSNYPMPSIVMLDLKMPGVDGFDVLRWIRRQPSLKSLPVIVLTSSEHIFDIQKAYQLGANSFLVKPLEFAVYSDMMRTLDSFWIKQSTFPTVENTISPPGTQFSGYGGDAAQGPA